VDPFGEGVAFFFFAGLGVGVLIPGVPSFPSLSCDLEPDFLFEPPLFLPFGLVSPCSPPGPSFFAAFFLEEEVAVVLGSMICPIGPTLVCA